MRTPTIAITALLLGMFIAQNGAQAQGLLEKLEKKLGEVIGAEQPPAAPVDPPVVDAPPQAEPEPAYLGLMGNPAAGRLGVQVLSVNRDGPAAAAGIQAGDVIVSVGDVAVNSLDDLSAILNNSKPGHELSFQVDRGRQRRQLAVTLGVQPAAAADELPPETLPAPPAETDFNRPSLGVVVAGASDEVRRRYGLVVRRGAVITEITPGGAADRAGLPLGAVIVAFDGIRVDSHSDLVALVRGARIGQEVELTYYVGNQLYRKTVRLSPAASPPQPGVPPAVDPPLRLGRPGAPRGPLLDRLEGVLDGIVRPQTGGPPPRSDDEVAALKQQVAALQQQLAQMQQRLAELEARLPQDDE